jgi:hypothetical protein
VDVHTAGGTVFHAGVLDDGPESANRRTVGLEAEAPRLCGAVALPLAG